MRRVDLFGRDDLMWSGKSVSEPSGPFFPTSPNLEMMGEDAGAAIYLQCHQRHSSVGGGFSSVSFGVEPEDEKVMNCFGTLVGGEYRDLDYNIAQFLNMIGRTIIVEGYFVYEFQVGRDKSTGKLVEMDFSPVSAPDDKAFVCGRHVVQLLSRVVAREYDCSRIRRLNPSDTFIFQAPKRWRRNLHRARSALRLFDAMEHRAMEEMGKAMRSRSHSYSGYDHAANVTMVARETAPLGWTGRGMFHGYGTDCQLFERQIRWNEFCIDLRDSMIRELERAVEKIAEILKCNCRLTVEERKEYTLEDVRKKLREGKTSTVKLVKLLF